MNHKIIKKCQICLNENLKQIPNEDYIPIKYDKNHEPMYLILMCRKTKY